MAQADQRARLLNGDAELLVQLAAQRGLGVLAGLDLATGKLPLAGIELVRGPLADQHFALRVAQRTGGDVDVLTCGTQR